jgi:hypothetical protein
VLRAPSPTRLAPKTAIARTSRNPRNHFGFFGGKLGPNWLPYPGDSEPSKFDIHLPGSFFRLVAPSLSPDSGFDYYYKACCKGDATVKTVTGRLANGLLRKQIDEIQESPTAPYPFRNDAGAFR